MQIHQLKPIHKNKAKKRVGRGGKKGTYSGRGQKGQKSRAGHKLAPVIRELIKRYPKLRGYRFKARKGALAVINVNVLDKVFNDSETVSPKSLLKKQLIRKILGKTPQVKILGKGKLTKNLIIKDCQVSKAVKEAIEEKGGKII